jgi:hypothetical protein
VRFRSWHGAERHSAEVDYSIYANNRAATNKCSEYLILIIYLKIKRTTVVNVKKALSAIR